MSAESLFNLKIVDFSLDGGTFVTVFGILDCASLCMKSKNCSSFFYNHNIHSCSISETRYTTTTGLIPHKEIKYHSTEKGFGMKCSSTAGCNYPNSICSKGTCQCAVGFSYLASDVSCVKRCSEYGHIFAVYEKHAIRHCNTRTLHKRSGEACMETCLKETEFICINAELEHGGDHYCNLCNTAWFDNPKAKRQSNVDNWTLFYRHCSK